MTEMQDKNGGYYSALDADSEGVEGKYYVWSYNELKTILKNDFEFFSKVFDIKSEGNWEGNIVLSRYDNLHIKKEDEDKIQLLLNKLKLFRQQRVRPQLDNKILADWNGLTIEAMAYSAKILNDKKYLNSAENAFLFIFEKMFLKNKLYHSNCMGSNKHFGMLDDYVHLCKAALMLFETTGKLSYLNKSILFTDCILSNFSSENGGFYTNSDDHIDVILKNIQYFDNVMPNANAVMISIFSKINLITSDDKYIQAQKKLINNFLTKVSNQYFGISSFLKNSYLENYNQLIIIAGKNKTQNEVVLDKVYKNYIDNIMVVMIDEKTQLDKGFKFYANITINETTSIYVCKNNTCSLPFTNIDLLKEYL
jgi:uncharacterized protein YyaL (SSP411 family)